MLTHRAVLLSALTSLVVTAICGAAVGDSLAEHKSTTPPNIVLIIGDDISQDDFSCYGQDAIRTPNIDRLAKSGVRFTQAYLVASSCSPSRCSLITGRYPHNNGPAAELHGTLPDHLALFPKLLKDAGYYTAQAGKWHIGSNTAYFVADMPAKAAFSLTVDGKSDDVSTAAEYDRFVEVIRDRPLDRPFFVWLATHDAHRHWTGPQSAASASPKDIALPPYLADTPATRRDYAAYLDEVIRFDQGVGRVMAELERQQITDNTVVIVMADNGRPFPRCKTRVFDGGIKTPLIVHWPGGELADGASCELLVSSIDIGPTILDIAGVRDLPETMQGRSFARLLRSPGSDFREFVFAEQNWHDTRAHQRLVRSGDFAYIRSGWPEAPVMGAGDVRFTPAGHDLYRAIQSGEATPAQRQVYETPQPQEMLFDLRRDPHQTRNLVDDSDHAQTLVRLRSALDRWIEQTGDTVPSNPTPNWCDVEASNRRGQYVRSKDFGKRGDPPGTERDATHINAPGPF